MVSVPAKARKRLTQAEALEQARAQMRAERVSPKPKRATPRDGVRVTDEDISGPRDRERWITLPKHLSIYVGEQAVISQGYVWTHRVDRRAARTDDNGVKRTPVRLVNLGPVDALDPHYKHEKKGPGQQTAKGAKTPGFVLRSAVSGSSSSDHLLENEGVLSPPSDSAQDRPGGRPKKNGHDDLILQLAAEGKGSKMIARTLKRDGYSISPRTVSRRLAEIRGNLGVAING